MISNASDQPFDSKRAIARHFQVNERTIFSWEIKHDWPSVPTPRSVTAFLERNQMDSRPSRQLDEVLDRFDDNFQPARSRLMDHVEACQEAARALPPNVSNRCLSEIDETLMMTGRAIFNQMTNRLTPDQVTRFMFGDHTEAVAVVSEVNPSIETE